MNDLIIDTSQWFYWNPSPNLFVLPFVGRPVAWYGLLFALGFLIAYFYERKLFAKEFASEEKATGFVDHLLWYVVFGTLIGARVGHVLFYGDLGFWENPLVIFQTWKGGLASHGGAIGIISALFLFRWRTKEKYPSATPLLLFDAVSIIVPFVGGCIRIGNFINQEIVGTVTQLPWAVVFGNPFSGVEVLPRHPVQLYEAIVYFEIFFLLHILWKKGIYSLGKGFYFGVFLLLTFTSRFAIEFLKLPQSAYIDANSWLSMGQYLSIPCILAGTFFLLRASKEKV